MNRFFTLLILIFSSSATLLAQIEKPYFQVFDISDDTKSIKIETSDSFKVRKWNGIQLMVDMTIQLDGGSMELLGMVIYDNRYSYRADYQANNLTVRAKIMRRDLTKLKYLGNICTEKVTTILYVPDGFEMRSPTEFVRKEETIIAAEKH